MTRNEARTIVARITRSDPDAACRTGYDLLRADYPELLLPLARKLARQHPVNPKVQQLLGLTARATGDSTLALQGFAAAARSDPGDPLIAHSHARAALETGVDATTLFRHAVRLAPQDGTVLQGLAAALFHANLAQDAIDHLDRLVTANPLWLDGHRDLAHLSGQLGLPPLAAIDRSLLAVPQSAELHRLRIALALEARDLDSAQHAVDCARQALGHLPWLTVLAGHVCSERGELAAADSQFASVARSPDIAEASLIARHLIRSGRPDAATTLLEPLVEADRDHLLWPYLSLAWRMNGDDRWHWLEGDPRLVGVYDIAPKLGDPGALASLLRTLHTARAAPLDQSVRGGTQTDGNLLLHANPLIVKLRKVLLDTVARHVRQLPAAVSGHPTLLHRRDPQRISGSWSVRLTDAGFHADHVHSHGWLSSAFYVSLPEGDGRSGHDGWLTLGECRDLVPALEPVKMVEPQPGRLVLFPSTMWHGTRPFPKGERMTVAFDIARPKQSDTQ